MGASGGKAAGKQQVIDYKLSVQYAVCTGPVDEVEQVYVGEKSLAIKTLATINTSQMLVINKPGLFGGPKKGGGVSGRIYFYLGEATQTLAAFLAVKLGRTSSTVSAYRGLLTLWFTGGGNGGFMWSSNIPVVPEVWVKVRRSPKGLSGDPMIGPDANPAHIVYEALTNNIWGAGYDHSSLDVQSFLDAAQVFRDEGFGISIKWTGQATIEEFINRMLKHISATLNFDLSTSKWSILPLRGGYSTSGLVEINPRNAQLVSFQRRAWGETVNEVVVTWTNPDSESEETVTQQDATGFAIQKSAVSDSSSDFVGIRNQDTAWAAAERELRQAGTPLAAADVDVSVSLRGIKPGQVVWFNWDEVEPDGTVFLPRILARVVKVSNPKRGAAHFPVSLVEDVFSYGVSPTESQYGVFSTPSREPAPVPNYMVSTEPYFFLANRLGDSAAESRLYPQVSTIILAATGEPDTRDIGVSSLRPVPEMAASFIPVFSATDLGAFELPVSLLESTVSTFVLPTNFTPDPFMVGGFLVITAEGKEEICLVTDLSDRTVTVARGCLDTTPQKWDSGTQVFEVPRNAKVSDPTEVSEGESLVYKLRPATSLGQLELDDSFEIPFEPTDRPYLPYRPANAKVNGQPCFTASIASSDSSLALSWANRNRLTETVSVLRWTDGSTAAEVGQTTTVLGYVGGFEVYRAEGLSGDTATVPLESFGLYPGVELRLVLTSERGGLESSTGAVINVSVT